MNISELLRGQPNLNQYVILERADVMFKAQTGRYYMGPISPEQAEELTRNLRLVKGEG